MLRVGPQSAGAAAGPGLLWAGRHRAHRHRCESRPRAGSAPTASSAARCSSTSRRRRARARAPCRRAARHGPRPTAADGILRVAATAMSYAVKGVTTERGLDVGDFVLVAYGGAGPLHAVAVARELGMRKVIVPPAPGVFSAFGMLFSDLRYDFVRTWFTRLDDADFAELERIYAELEEQGRRNIASTSVAAGRDHDQARRRHALCRTGARRHRRSADGRVRSARTARRSSAISTRSTNSAMAPARPRSVPRS